MPVERPVHREHDRMPFLTACFTTCIWGLVPAIHSVFYISARCKITNAETASICVRCTTNRIFKAETVVAQFIVVNKNILTLNVAHVGDGRVFMQYKCALKFCCIV